MEAKRALRIRLRAARAARTDQERAAAAPGLAQHGISAVRDARTVAAYASIRDEPPTQLLLDQLLASGVDVLLPVVAADMLRWAPYRSWDELRRTETGLLEPAADIPRRTIETADVVLLPALAVDRRGHRLGRGAGFYDRALAGVSRARLIAVVFTDEVVDSVPAEAHDVAVGAALTPDGLVTCGDQ